MRTVAKTLPYLFWRNASFPESDVPHAEVPGYRYLGPDNGMSVIFSNWNCMVFFVWHLKRCGCLFILVANRRDIAAIQIVFGQNATIKDFLKLSTLLTFWRNLRKRAFILGLVTRVLFEPAQITDHKYFLSSTRGNSLNSTDDGSNTRVSN